jgi:hypothetical protein
MMTYLLGANAPVWEQVVLGVAMVALAAWVVYVTIQYFK